MNEYANRCTRCGVGIPQYGLCKSCERTVAAPSAHAAGDGSLQPLDGTLEAELEIAREAKTRARVAGEMMLYQYWLNEVVDIQMRMESNRRQRPIDQDQVSP